MSEPSDPARPAPARFQPSWELVIDKTVDFFLVFIGLYAAIAVQRVQDEHREKGDYRVLLADFQRELEQNRAQHASIERDLGSTREVAPGRTLGPMARTFAAFLKEMDEDEDLVDCLHAQFAAGGRAKSAPTPRCQGLYAAFDAASSARRKTGRSTPLPFEAATLSPFYRYEVWDLYLATGAKIFVNKDLAVKIGEVYNDARLIEKQVAEIEQTYNDVFMRQAGRMIASEAELAELVHEEESSHGLSPQDLAALVHLGEQMKDERYATLQAESVLEAKVRRMKTTVERTNGEIAAVVDAIEAERAKVGR